jgi:hypothetical protein
MRPAWCAVRFSDFTSVYSNLPFAYLYKLHNVVKGCKLDTGAPGGVDLHDGRRVG